MEHAITKPDDVNRIVVIGDSHTYGVVPLEDVYTRRLEAIFHQHGYRNIEVITLGVGAWGADQKLWVLEREGIHYKPDIVLYQFAANDIGDNLGWGAGKKSHSNTFSSTENLNSSAIQIFDHNHSPSSTDGAFG